jgi:hypothetical protein
MNGNRFNNTHNARGSYNNNAQPSRFSAKRSHSPSPVRTSSGRPSRFDNPHTNGTQNHNGHGNDYKRARTDSSRPPHVRFFYLK